MIRVFVHSTLDHDGILLRFRDHVLKTEGAHQVELTPDGQHHLVVIEAKSVEIVAAVEADPDVTLLPHRASPKPLADETAARLSHLGVKKGDTMYAALSSVYALTKCASFHPDVA